VPATMGLWDFNTRPLPVGASHHDDFHDDLLLAEIVSLSSLSSFKVFSSYSNQSLSFKKKKRSFLLITLII